MSFFLFKQKTAYEMRISDWSSDVCSSDLNRTHLFESRLRSFTHDASELRNGRSGQRYPIRRFLLPSLSPPLPSAPLHPTSSTLSEDRKSVVSGKSVSVRVDFGGRSIIKKTKNVYNIKCIKPRSIVL